MNSANEQFSKLIESYGFKTRIVPISQLDSIKSDLEETLKHHGDIELNLKTYLSNFEFDIPPHFENATSLIVIAVPQPITKVQFMHNNKKNTVILPPMYLLNSSIKNESKHKEILNINSLVEEALSTLNSKCIKINLPAKISAVNSGLGQYGRNNICYIDGQSSYYWIATYISDLMHSEETCKDKVLDTRSIMTTCDDCNLCLTTCPTQAINNNRFVIHANKCLTLYNERSQNFPDWIKSKWHNAIIGCMRCQLVCPVNKKNPYNIKNSIIFSNSETDMILSRMPLNKLPKSLYLKLETINFLEDYNLLARNLDVLLK